MNIFKS